MGDLKIVMEANFSKAATIFEVIIKLIWESIELDKYGT